MSLCWGAYVRSLSVMSALAFTSNSTWCMHQHMIVNVNMQRANHFFAATLYGEVQGRDVVHGGKRCEGLAGKGATG